ncbi:hypothetical protein QJQ45_009241 [Haematococcus lacustris]|nr:hypothetical protein QJQ45_009241 [Haematococcus lacustris]
MAEKQCFSSNEPGVMAVPSSSLVLALSLAILAWSAFAADPGWQEGRGTWFDVQDGDLRTANCHFRWDQVRTGKYIGAFSDTNPMFRGSCGKCIELRCQNADFKDGFGQTLNRKNACKDPKRSIFVTIADACPCHYPSNHHSNKRWCCGDSSRTHIDVTQEAFAQLADLGHGVHHVQVLEHDNQPSIAGLLKTATWAGNSLLPQWLGPRIMCSSTLAVRWLAPIKPHLPHLAAASSAGTSLVANLMHITVTLATWDVVWEVYLDPKWAEQRLRLCGAQDRAPEQTFKQSMEDMAELSMERHGRSKQLVVFFGAANIGTGGGWGAAEVLRACCKVVCRPRGSDQLWGRVVLVDEHHATRVSSTVNGQQPCEEELDHEQPTMCAGWKAPAGQGEPRLLRPAWSQQHDQPVRGMMWCPVVAPRKPPQAPCNSQAATQPAASEPGSSTLPPAKCSKRTKAEQAAKPPPGKAQGKAAKAKPAPQPGRWLDRDCIAALNMQCIGESKWRPLELCYWPEQGMLPARGKEYPGLGYKRLRDKPPKAQPAMAQ